jgi:transketolase
MIADAKKINQMLENDTLEAVASRIRRQVIFMSHRTGAAHLGSSLSCVDILVALYYHILKIEPKDPNNKMRDRFILSKGHAIATQYAILADKGFFPVELLATFAQPDSCLPEHPAPRCVPGLEVATGSLGHGLSIGLGMALAGRIQQQSYQVYVVVSDGECNEGSVWEAALLAPAQKIGNLTVIIDYNKWQATGRSNEVMALEPLMKKWSAFGWDAYEIDGHNIKELIDVLSRKTGNNHKPTAIIAHTIKGKGVSFMEDDNNWHYRIPNAEELNLAMMELG